jgi:hypothetical protein
MRIALDYDKTYTADPVLWDGFARDALARGHAVFVVTMRMPSEPVDGISLPVIYTSRKAKSSVVEADIWIDDCPQYIFEDAF